MKKAIVTGMIVSYPVGGVLWDYGQYALGLEKMGYEVYYLEDTGWETYDPVRGEYGTDCTYGVDFLARSLSSLSPTLGQRWHFRCMDGRTFGIAPEELQTVLAESEIFLNVSGGTLLRDEYMSCRNKILIDTDPGWNHFRNYPKWDAQPNWYGSHGFRAHDHFFTYAERLGKAGCRLPDMNISWNPTRPPVVMDCWQPLPPGRNWTTVMTWKNFQETIEYQGVSYGTKEMEFDKVHDIPRHVSAPFEIAMGGARAPVDLWKEAGWSIVSAPAVSKTAGDYQNYIECSRGEFSVAKNVYVDTQSGWFSCRSVCYLAAGRPVVVQDTGFSKCIPTGKGLFAFTNMAEAVQAIQEVEHAYTVHQQAAIDMAREFFDAPLVLGGMLRKIGCA